MPHDISAITRGSVIAALYVALTLVFQPISFGYVQFRVSEAMALLPFLWIEAVPGLFVGCLVANFRGGLGLWDVVLGSAATLVAALASRFAPTPFWAALPPVVVNGLVVGGYLSFLLNIPPYLSVVYVALGEAMACYALGIPLVRFVERTGLGNPRKNHRKPVRPKN